MNEAKNAGAAKAAASIFNEIQVQKSAEFADSIILTNY
jgi:hypothetical protein